MSSAVTTQPSFRPNCPTLFSVTVSVHAGRCSDVNKDWTLKDKDQAFKDKDKDKDWTLNDKDQAFKDKDKDKDWTLNDKDQAFKDKDKDKDWTLKDKDKDKDLTYNDLQGITKTNSKCYSVNYNYKMLSYRRETALHGAL